jgi:hypothetical protein
MPQSNVETRLELLEVSPHSPRAGVRGVISDDGS